jgi:TolB-like protein/Tfp pilus assembly protein PilF
MQQGMILGTARYMSPEQARGQAAHPRSDLWSLGVVLYEMLAGRPPFDGETPTDVIAAVLLKQPAPVEQRATIVPPALQSVVERALRKDPAERYQKAEELLSELRATEERPAPIVLPSNRARWVGVAAFAAVLMSLAVFYGWRERHVMRESAPAVVEKGIAVLPFENLSAQKDDAFFTDGVQDEILTKLAKIADLKVVSRTSVMQYRNAAPRSLREIAQQLGVDHVLEGSVQRAGQRVRVNVRLVDARNHVQLWAQTYDRDLADVFAIQSEIAASIAEQLRTHLSAGEKAAIAQAPTHNLVANDLYLRAKELWASEAPSGKQNLLKAVRLLEEAVTHDPGFVLAYCLLCTIHLDIYWVGFDHTTARRELAGTALQNATRLQPDAGEVHAARANYAYHGFRDYDQARAELEFARRTLPNNAELYFYGAAIDRRQARWNEAIRNFERAIELDPRNFSIVVEAAFTHCVLRRFAESRQLLERALSISPGDHFVRSELVRLDFLERGELDSWHNQLSAVVNEGPTAASSVAFQLVWCALSARDRDAAARALTFIPPEGALDVRSNALFPREWFVGLVAQISGDKSGAQTAFTAARPILERMTVDQPEYAPAWSLLGMIDAALGRKENAIREGRHACELLPVSKDAWAGPSWVTNLATIYAWIGENDVALQQLENSAANFGVAYGELKLFPIWDSLRSDPRFDQILASLAPKD